MAAITSEGTPREVERGESYLTVKRGILSWIITLDHKRIGILYLVPVLLFFSVGGLFALLVRLELIAPGRTIMDASTYNKMFTLHGAAMVFLFIIPSVPASLGNFILPIMLGAKDVAFPRLNLASYYIYLLGACFALYAIVSGGVDTGWTFYTPYSTREGGAVIAMVLGAFIMGFSSILTGLNFLVTIHKLRAPGQSWRRLPLFAWAMYATAIMQLCATPVLAITLLLLVLERAFDIGIFDPHKGGDPVLFQHFFWFYSHPAVYIMIVPGMGIANELIATFSQRKIMGYSAVAMSSLGLALLGFLVWGHHMFTSGESEFANTVFSALTFLVAIPSGVKIFNWLGTLYRGSISLQSPMLYGLAFLFLFTIGGLTGLFLATLATDIHLHDTYFVVAHFHYTMMGGTVFAFFGGLHYWWPKITGKMYREKLAVTAFIFLFIGFNVTFLTQFVLGARGMPRRYYDYIPEFQTLHMTSTVGSWLLGVGFLVMFYMFVTSLISGPKAPRNPWRSAGYEWMTPTPPPLENFPEQPHFHRGPYDYDLATEAELAED